MREGGRPFLTLDRLSESLGTESGIGAGEYLERCGNRFREASESRVICGLEIPRSYFGEKGESGRIRETGIDVEQ